ncbi:MAG: hypothetical protein ACYCV7_14250 [Acidimicrobiales bacterium]
MSEVRDQDHDDGPELVLTFANRPKDQEALPELHRLQDQMRGEEMVIRISEGPRPSTCNVTH